ncbi:hypothetical protein F4823DRAFT_557379 [Ustulina deusta]|nr:hypothetical protein F4823DRAFT_557379 [Ustulina deusta]
MLGKSTRRICGLICIFIVLVCIWATLIPWLDMPIEDVNRTHYDILDVDIDASVKEIKRAYRKHILPYHPDKVQRLSAAQRAKAKSKYDEIHESYEFLLSDKRCLYDVVVMKVSLREYAYCLERFVRQRRLDLAFTQEQKRRRFEEKAKEKEERERAREQEQRQEKEREQEKKQEIEREQEQRQEKEREQEKKQEIEREQEGAYAGEDLKPSTTQLMRLESALARVKALFGQVVEIPCQIIINIASFVAIVAIMAVR